MRYSGKYSGINVADITAQRFSQWRLFRFICTYDQSKNKRVFFEQIEHVQTEIK